MGWTTKHVLIGIATIAWTLAAGCKSDGDFIAREKTAGEEVEFRMEHGDTAMDEADGAVESEMKPPDGDTEAK